MENINELLIKDIKDLTPEDINDKTIDELIGLKFIIFKIMNALLLLVEKVQIIVKYMI